MGGYVTKYIPFSSEGSRKRRHSFSNENEEENLIWPSKRRKSSKISTPKVIYETMFKTGSYSDIKIVTCGHEWNLHKPILKQCPYFAVMLSEPWKESQQDVINIEIVDPNINREAIDFVFGSLYCSDHEIPADNVVGVIAAASHFQFESVVVRCAEMINLTMKNNNIMKYFSIAEQYGVPLIKEHAMVLLLRNLVCNKYFWPILHQISVEVMATLVGSPDLIVNHSETNVHKVLIRWLYCHLQSSSPNIRYNEICAYFQNLPGTVDFLSTEQGFPFQPAFSSLRLRHMLITSQIIHSIFKTRVIPHQWIRKAITDNYMESLRVHEGNDRGPTDRQVEEMGVRGLRFGKIVKTIGDVSWRWHMPMVGFDLSWALRNKSLAVWRSRQTDYPTTLSDRRIIVRVKFMTLAAKATPCHRLDPLSINLPINHKVDLVKVPEKLSFPAMISVQVLLTADDPSTTSAQ